MIPAAPIDAHGGARLLARWVVIERALFEVTGAAAGGADDDEVALVLGAESRHHAWRASQLAGLLPLLADQGPEAWLTAATGELAELLAALRAPRPSSEVLGLVHETVNPALRAAWAERRARGGPATDAELVRALRLVELDASLDAEAAAATVARIGGDDDALTSLPAMGLLASIASPNGSGGVDA